MEKKNDRTINMKSFLVTKNLFYLTMLYLASFTFFYFRSSEGTQDFVIMFFEGLGITIVLLVQAFSFFQSNGVKKKFIGFITIATTLYYSVKVARFFLEQPLLESLPPWDQSTLFNLLYIISYIFSFTLLILPIRNRVNFLYYSMDLLILFLSLFVIVWHWWIFPLFLSMGLSMPSSISLIGYPLLQFLLFIGLLATLFIKKYFFPRMSLLLFSIAIGLQFVTDNFFLKNEVVGDVFWNGILQIGWTASLFIQAIAINRLVEDKREFKLGESIFHYKDYSHSLWRNLMSGGVILFLFTLYSKTEDILVGVGFITIILFLFIRQFLSSYQYKLLADSYQHLTKSLEKKIENRTIELVEKNEELMRTFDQLEHMAMHDQLTGLANRRGLKLELDKLMKKNIPFSLVFMDIDQFKEVNDEYGHSYGDQLLIEFTKRFTSLLPSDAILARQSGDEFIIVLKHIHTREEITIFSKELLLLCKKAFQVMEKEIHITFSAGVAIYPEHGKDIQELIKNADKAMYTVKEKGKDNIHIIC